MITNTYNKYASSWAHRNNTHTDMIEQAAADRVLFLNEASQSVRHVDLRFPEYVSSLRLGVVVGHFMRATSSAEIKRLEASNVRR